MDLSLPNTTYFMPSSLIAAKIVRLAFPGRVHMKETLPHAAWLDHGPAACHKEGVSPGSPCGKPPVAGGGEAKQEGQEQSRDLPAACMVGFFSLGASATRGTQ
eukprot:scaffold30268_cov20-Tisochrysis_lutea.AAC.8